MTRLERNANIAAVIIPFAGVIAAGVLLWHHLLGPLDIALFAAMYLTTAIGITVGFHRLLTHRAFETHRPLRYALAVLGSMAIEGSVIDWVADHRKHHTFADEEGDPHSPHVHSAPGLKGMLQGLWHAHAGWLFSEHGQASSRRYAADLLADPTMRRINRSFPALALASLLLPALLGFALSGGSATAALAAFIWAGLVRIFLVHHITWSINSVCHFFGRRRFDTRDRSTNVFWLALPSLGEAWHHNHHAFPRSAFHGLRWYELDPSGWIIRALAAIGLAWDVVRVDPARAAAREVARNDDLPAEAPAQDAGEAAERELLGVSA
ncbi:MAG TPA: acyl-CoA desaturase [Solirubrobacteraceae bacterium]|nr:acyl-CoA desaturase [Solirubrobacteraceae bacterium]